MTILHSGVANGMVSYSAKYSYNIPVMPDRNVSAHIAMQDARWRGHTQGANDGIMLRTSTREAGAFTMPG